MLNLEQTAESLIEQAKRANRLAEFSQAAEYYSQAEKIFAESANLRGQTRCWSGLGKSYGKQKNFPQAIAAFEKAIYYAQVTAWPEKELEAAYNLGLTLQQVGLKEAHLEIVHQAIERFKQALAIANQIQDKQSAGVLCITAGLACAWSKLDEEAIFYLRSATTALDDKDFDTAFSVLSSLGVLLSNHNRAAEAIPYYERALALAKSAEGDLEAVADTYANLGIAYEKADRLPEAIEAIEFYREILSHVGDIKAADAAALLKRLKNKAKLAGIKGF